MLYIVSNEDLKETANNAGEKEWFAYLGDAEEAAKRIANETGMLQHIYSFVRHHSIMPEPERTYRLCFKKIDGHYMTVNAHNLEEAIEKGKDRLSSTDYEFYDHVELAYQETPDET